MKTQFCLTQFCLIIAAALLALTAFSYGQVGTDVKDAAKDTGHATKKAAVKTGHATKKAAVKTGEATEKAADKTGDATETAAKKTGHGVKKGAKAVGHGVKKGAEKTEDVAKKIARSRSSGRSVFDPVAEQVLDVPDLVADQVDLVRQALDLGFRAAVYFVVEFASQPVFFILPVLAHHDDRRLNRRQHGEKQIEQNERIGVPGAGR